ncbi:hypothetical protein GCM10009804_03250 [Kribbella hippodromi]|uniref:N-acetylmuramoyl-L-alanine amidase domain-containing protein n=1 Tax=Kribbella hippodromi TaxID=434347 RepID=A0ABP4MU53_9ACTN
MALYPGARQRPIPPGSNDPAIIPIGVVLHVDAGNSGSLYDYFDGKSGGIESHLFIRKDGGVEQYRDTQREADANYHGNSFVRDGKTYGFISVETQGFAAGEWTDAQLSEIKKFLLWAHRTHGIPLRLCPAWDQPGVGWHVMWGAPGPWTNARGKVCPGPDRVKQFNNVLVPWFASATKPVEDDMPYTPDQIRAMVQAELEEYNARFWTAPTGTGTAIRAQLDRIEKTLDDEAAKS